LDAAGGANSLQLEQPCRPSTLKYTIGRSIFLPGIGSGVIGACYSVFFPVKVNHCFSGGQPYDRNSFVPPRGFTLPPVQLRDLDMKIVGVKTGFPEIRRESSHVFLHFARAGIYISQDTFN